MTSVLEKLYERQSARSAVRHVPERDARLMVVVHITGKFDRHLRWYLVGAKNGFPPVEQRSIAMFYIFPRCGQQVPPVLEVFDS